MMPDFCGVIKRFVDYLAQRAKDLRMIPLEQLTARLETATAATAAAQAEIDGHASTAAREATLQAAAEAGTITEAEAAELLDVAEARRMGDILGTGRQRRREDAFKAEVATALEILRDLATDAEALVNAAEEAAAALTGALIAPAVVALDPDRYEGQARDRALYGAARCWSGVAEADALLDRVRNAARTTWGSGHVPSEARDLLAVWPTASAAVRSGIARITAAATAAGKAKKAAA
jgi:hypothetical protein